jgi:asparagine synthase (glutamine-hydrolysing)
MCGVIGAVVGDGCLDVQQLIKGCETLRHRGPDGMGYWVSSEGCVGFAHRRLAIIDLTVAGRQPMLDVAGRICIVYNGEIYNFRELRRELEILGHCFRTQSDTEVLIAAYLEWDTDCLARLNGMFAFALYDSRKRRLFAARDRAGEKPFYYAIAGKRCVFASELKGLMEAGWVERRLDPEALHCYLSMGFVPGDRCILHGVRKLPPAHALVFDQEVGSCRVWPYWRVPELDSVPFGKAPDEESILTEFEGLLEDSVRRQLVADVPVGVLLSGGVDSSLVTAMAVRSSPKVKTFTIRFPGHGRHDETEHARLVARHFGTEHVELEAENSTVDLLPLLARQFDEPMVDSSMLPTYLVSRLIRRHCTVALGGDGGDELFGGYGHHSRLLWTSARSRWIPRILRAAVAKAAQHLMPVGFKGRNWLQGLACDWRNGLPLIAVCFDRKARTDLLKNTPCRDWIAEEVWTARIPRNPDLLQRATRMDFENYLPEDILVKVDRASMLYSLEVRAPFLDYRIIEFAFSRVPSSRKATSNGRKILLKKLTTRVLPPEFDRHRKQGFSIPISSWLQDGPWLNFFRDVLLGQSESFFDRRTLEGLFRGQAAGRNNSERLFGLVMFELWRREYKITL